MLQYIETHGFELLVSYYILISILGTLPPLPDNASYLQKWGFAIAHAICGNARSMMASINTKISDEPKSLQNSTGSSISSTTSVSAPKPVTDELPKENG